MKLEAVRWRTGLAGCTKSSNLNNVDGGTGVGKTNPAIPDSTNATVKYTDLIAKIG
jgi:hypothetical protein